MSNFFPEDFNLLRKLAGLANNLSGFEIVKLVSFQINLSPFSKDYIEILSWVYIKKNV